MSVDLLYCEGGEGKTDSRVLSQVLDGLCQIKTIGSKYGFKEKVLMSRELKPETIIAGLRDRDFDDFEQNESLPQFIPQEWQVTDNQNSIHLGWYWERKEIENYLIDPQIVIPALGEKAPSLDNYQSILENSALKIYTYTAARIALSLSRVRLLPLPNNWGEKKWRILFPFGQTIDEASCRLEIQRIRTHYQSTQVPQEQDIIAKFTEMLTHCQPGGFRFDNQSYLTFFSGKDLLCAMEEDLANLNLGTPADFRERILTGMKKLSDVWQYLPEWQRLRQLIQDYQY
ncbi:hypothetical protein A6770_22690 [Nostoc minutum NIES-26]|uniref:DUF4435 domain-containing protein n=1 Tax=Nostoc minutum NIES-26 TaxID=1844469 RepID=A0A367QZZ2_9NOSO|nr:hypothetical protein A6770_22690 [Nostoc minutum NIES-26]